MAGFNTVPFEEAVKVRDHADSSAWLQHADSLSLRFLPQSRIRCEKGCVFAPGQCQVGHIVGGSPGGPGQKEGFTIQLLAGNEHVHEAESKLERPVASAYPGLFIKSRLLFL